VAVVCEEAVHTVRGNDRGQPPAEGMDLAKVVNALEICQGSGTDEASRRQCDLALSQLRQTPEAWSSGPDWISQYFSSESRFCGNDSLLFFSLGMLSDALDQHWESVPPATIAATKSQLLSIIHSPAAIGISSFASVKITSLLAVLMLHEWPDRDPSFPAVWADHCLVAAREAASTGTPEAIKRSILAVNILCDFFHALTGVLSVGAHRSSRESSRRARLSALNRLPALRSGMRMQGLAISRSLVSIAVASSSSTSLQMVGWKALESLGEAMQHDTVEIDQESISSIARLYATQVVVLQKHASDAIRAARDEMAVGPSWEHGMTVSLGAPTVFVCHAVAAVAALMTDECRRRASDGIADLFGELAFELAGAAEACLSGAACSHNKKTAASVAKTLVELFSSMDSPVATVALEPMRVRVAAICVTLESSASAVVARIVRRLVKPFADPVHFSSWFVVPDDMVESVSLTMRTLVDSHCRELSTPPTLGTAPPMAPLAAIMFAITTKAGHTKGVMELLPVWERTFLAAAGADGPEAVAGLTSLAAGAVSVTHALLKNSLYCPSLVDSDSTDHWPGVGGGVWVLNDVTVADSKARASDTCTSWVPDSTLSAECAMGGETADDWCGGDHFPHWMAADSTPAVASPDVLSSMLELKFESVESMSELRFEGSWASLASIAPPSEYETWALSSCRALAAAMLAYPPVLAHMASSIPPALELATHLAVAVMDAAPSGSVAELATKGSFTVSTLLAVAATGRPAARDAAFLLRCGAALCDVTARLPRERMDAALTAACDAVGSAALAVCKACSDRRAFSRGYAWIDLHYSALAALRSHAVLRAAAGRAVVEPLIASAMMLLDTPVAPPSETLIRCAVGAVKSAVAIVEGVPGATDSLLAPIVALADSLRSKTASLPRLAKADLASALIVTSGAGTGADPISRGASGQVLAPALELFASLPNPATPSDVEASARSIALVHRAQIEGHIANLRAVFARAHSRGEERVLDWLWAGTRSLLPVLSRVVALSLTLGRFTAKRVEGGPPKLKASCLWLAASSLDCLRVLLQAVGSRCAVDDVRSTLATCRPIILEAVRVGTLSPATTTADSHYDALVLRMWMRLLNVAMRRPELGKEHPSVVAAVLEDLSLTLAAPALGFLSAPPTAIAPDQDTLAGAPLLLAISTTVDQQWSALTMPSGGSLAEVAAARSHGPRFVSSASLDAVSKALGVFHIVLSAPFVEPRLLRVAIRALAKLHAVRRILASPELGSRGVTAVLLERVLWLGIAGASPVVEAEALLQLKAIGSSDARLAELLSTTVAPPLLAKLCACDPRLPAIRDGASTLVRILLDPTAGDQDLRERCTTSVDSLRFAACKAV
jgi:hypothetical protein